MTSIVLKLWPSLGSLADFAKSLFTLMLVCLSLLPSLTALSPARLIALSCQWPAWLLYFKCEKGRRTGKKCDSSYHIAVFFLGSRGAGQQQSPCVRSVVAGRAVCAQQGCNGMSGFMSCTRENTEGRRTSRSAWYNSSYHGVKSSRTSAPASQMRSKVVKVK